LSLTGKHLLEDYNTIVEAYMTAGSNVAAPNKLNCCRIPPKRYPSRETASRGLLEYSFAAAP
jgi:hypothetical protein